MNSSEYDLDYFAASLISWFKKNQRPLPWRQNPTLYNRLVSEFMLQQTQVATVIPYYIRWMNTFPTIATLAKASESQVFKLWEGLGYYSRAKNLYKIAQWITDHQEYYPQSAEEWETLPGIGPYTASALASIAQNLPVAAVDGNVVRVLCRINAIQEIFKNKTQAVQKIRPLALKYVPEKESSAYNEALIEFGALICKPKNPLCLECPIASECRCYQERLDPNTIPKFQKIIYKKRQVNRILLHNQYFILLKCASSTRLKDIYELPLLEDISLEGPIKEIAQIKRSIAHERIVEHIFIPENSNLLVNTLDLQKELSTNKTKLEKISLKLLQKITLSGPHRKWTDHFFKNIP